MIRALTYLALLAAGPVWAEEAVPSGLSVQLHETIFEPAGVPASSAKTVRLRYVASEIADREAFGFDVIEADFIWLCQRDGLNAKAQSAPLLEEVIVSIASEIVPFGETAPNVAQYFDAFRVADAACIWEGL